MRPSELTYLDEVFERSKERRSTFFGPRKTTRAETADTVLAAYAPGLVQEVRWLRAALRDLIEAVDSELDCDNRSRAFVERLSAARTIYQQQMTQEKDHD